MSFEGYYQGVCKNGHYVEFNVDYGWDEPERYRCTCLKDDKTCGAPIAWWNCVDDTNCDEAGRVNDFKEIEPEVTCSCDKCGHTHIVSDATVEIPENVGHKTESKKMFVHKCEECEEEFETVNEKDTICDRCFDRIARLHGEYIE